MCWPLLYCLDAFLCRLAVELVREHVHDELRELQAIKAESDAVEAALAAERAAAEAARAAAQAAERAAERLIQKQLISEYR